MKKISKVLSVLFALLIGQTICTPIFAESRTADQKAKDISVYSTEINGSNAVKANAENEEFLFGESEVVYDFDKAVRIYTDISSLTDPVSLKEDTTTKEFLVPVKDRNGSFISYAEFVTDDDGYKLVSVSQGDYYTELYNTLECDNFKDYEALNSNIYIYSDPSLNDIGFYVQRRDCDFEYLDYTQLYNDGIYITTAPVNNDYIVNDNDISRYLSSKSMNSISVDNSDTGAFNTLYEEMSADDFINEVGVNNIDDITSGALAANANTSVMSATISGVLLPNHSYTWSDVYSMNVNDCLYFTAAVNTLNSGDEVEIGLKNTTYDCTYSNTIDDETDQTVHETVHARLSGQHKVWMKNNTSHNVSVSMSYYIILFHDSTNDYNIYIPCFGQVYSHWCWAACTQMIASYYGYDVSQADIVTAVHGSLDNAEGGDGNEYQEAMEFATDGHYSARRISSAYSATVLKTRILWDLPTMILFTLYNPDMTVRGGHATVLTGIDSTLSYIRVNDPANNGTVKCHLYSYITGSTTLERYTATTIMYFYPELLEES